MIPLFGSQGYFSAIGPLVGEKQAPSELVTSLPPIDLELHTSPKLEIMDIA